MFPSFLLQTLTWFVAYAHGAFRTFKLLENRSNTSVTSDDDALLKYWLSIGLFTLFERLCDWFFRLFVPLYYEAKLLFVLWLAHSVDGADVFYTRILRRQLIQHEGQLDEFVGRTGDYINAMSRGVLDFASARLADLWAFVLIQASQFVNCCACFSPEFYIYSLWRNGGPRSICTQKNVHARTVCPLELTRPCFLASYLGAHHP